MNFLGMEPFDTICKTFLHPNFMCVFIFILHAEKKRKGKKYIYKQMPNKLYIYYTERNSNVRGIAEARKTLRSGHRRTERPLQK